MASSNLIIAPPVHKGLTQLNKELFNTVVQLTALRVPTRYCNIFMSALNG